MIDRRTFLLSAAALVAGVPNVSLARSRCDGGGFPSPEVERVYESVELLRRILPRVERVGLMYDTDSPVDPLHVRQSLCLAEKIGVSFLPVGVRSSDQVEPAFSKLSGANAEALIVLASLLPRLGEIVELAAARRLPAICGAPGFAGAIA